MVIRLAAKVMTRLFEAISWLLLPLNRRQTASGLRLLGSKFLPGDLMVDGALVGGLSGIDYDPVGRRWVMVTDDRSTDAPARFYSATIGIAGDRLGAFKIMGQTTFTRADGMSYPTRGSEERVPDIESVRVDPVTGDIWYITEGDGPTDRAPILVVAGPAGQFVRRVPLPTMFDLTRDRTSGPRHNQAFESLAFSTDGSLWICLEGPMYEDGEPPSTTCAAPVRLTNLDRDGNVIRQVVYELEPMRRSVTRFELADVSEILALDDNRLLVIEREATIGRLPIPGFTIRIFEIDVCGATNVHRVASLREVEFVPVRKRLVLDLNWRNAGLVTNIEGMAFGPALDNGYRTLALVTDNNQIGLLPTQLTVFEILDTGLSPSVREASGRPT